MVSTVFAFIFLVAFSLWFGQYLHARHPFTDLKIFRLLIPYHFVLTVAYYTYALFNPSDAHFYYIKVERQIYGANWLNYYGTSTQFIDFLGYPLANYLGFSFEATMIIFSIWGLLGFFYFYVVLQERLKYDHKIFGYSIFMIVLFLPNLHFWSGSFGKGAVIFMGFGMYFYALNNIKERWISGLIGALIIYHVRPHIMLVVLISTLVGFVFSSRGISYSIKVLAILIAVASVYFVIDDVLKLAGIEEEDILGQVTDLSNTRTVGIDSLARARSGIDISQYNLFMKLFTFWFRPLFFDVRGMLYLIVSFENLFYLIVFLKLFKTDFISFFNRSDHVVKASFLAFLGTSFALAQISANLGLAMRQKSQVMMLMMFVILKFMDEQQLQKDDREALRKKIAETRGKLKPGQKLQKPVTS